MERARRCELVLPELGFDPQQPIRASLWLVRRGAQVIQGQPVLEVLAGPATIDLPAPVDGRLVEMLVEEDEALAVGQPLAVFACPAPR